MSDTEEITKLAVLMVTRQDQLKLLDKITKLEEQIKRLEYLFKHHNHLSTPSKVVTKPRRKT